MDFGLLEIGPAAMLTLGPEANARSRGRPSGPTRALVCRRATDPECFPAVDAASTIVTDCPRQTAVDDGGHAVDRQRGLGDVCAQNDLPAIALPERTILFFSRQRTVQREYDSTTAGRGRLDTSAEASYLGESG